MRTINVIAINRAILKALGLEGRPVQEVVLRFGRDNPVAEITLAIDDELAGVLSVELERYRLERK